MIQISFFLIHCNEHTDRMKFVNENISNFSYPIEIYKGIYNNVEVKNTQELFELVKKYNKDFKFPVNLKCARTAGSIGCYLSHNLLLKHILSNFDKYTDYIVCLEDDVILNDTYFNNIMNTINIINDKKINFDICYLYGRQKNIDNEKNKIIDNIYKLNPEHNIFSTASMLINKKNIKKIYDATLIIQHQIDSQYRLLAKENKLNVIYLNPTYTKVNWSLKSNIKPDTKL